MPSWASIMTTARMPGVSSRTPPPGSGTSSRVTVVWRPLPSPTRTSRVACRCSPSRALMSVDLPTPDGPIRATVFPSPAYARTTSMPIPAVALVTRTSTPSATSRTSAAHDSASAASARSALVRTTTGTAPLSHASASSRSMRRRFGSGSTGWTTNTVSTLAAITCGVEVSSEAPRVKAEARGRMASMTAASWVGAGSSTTQSPQAGGPSLPALARPSARRRPSGRAWPAALSRLRRRRAEGFARTMPWAAATTALPRPLRTTRAGTWPASACAANSARQRSE